MLEKSCGWWLIWYFLFFCHGGAEATESRPYIDPNITQSSKVMSPQGQPLVINCGIDGFPKPLITWYKSLEVRAPDDRVRVLSNGSLHFMLLTTGDQGYYYCDGKNDLGQVKSAEIFVEVAYIKLHFEKEPDSQYIIGKSRTLPCSPPASHPPANVTWYKDNQPMKNRTGEHAAYILDPAKSIWDLFFTDIQKQDEGSYFCIASNNFAVPMSRTSKSAVVQIEGQLQWVVKEKVTDYGQNVTLFCPVENCCSELAGWSVGQESIFIDLKKYSNDSSKKYGGTYNKDGFGIVIRNLSEADLNVTHRCDYGFDRSTPKYLLHDDVFIESTDVFIESTDVFIESTGVPGKDEEIDIAAIVGCIIGAGAMGLIIIGIIVYCVRRKKKRQNSEGAEAELTAFITSDDQQDSSSNPDEVPLMEVVDSHSNSDRVPLMEVVVVYRVDVTFTDILYTKQLDDGNSNKFKSLAGNIQTDLTKLFVKVPGKQVVVIMQFKPGSLLTTFDLKSCGYYGESVLRKTIEKPLKDGIIGSYKASLEGFKFKAFSGDFHGAIVEKYRTKPKILKDLLDDKMFLSKLLEECGKNTEGLYPRSLGGIGVENFPAALLVAVMKYRQETQIVEEVLKDMSTTLTSQSSSTVVILYHRSVKTAMEKVCKDCKKPIDKEDCKKQIDKEDCEQPIDKEDCKKQIDKEDCENAIDKEDCEKPIDKEDCEKQIEMFKKFIKDHKFDYSASSCLQQCINK